MNQPLEIGADGLERRWEGCMENFAASNYEKRTGCIATGSCTSTVYCMMSEND